MKRVLLFAMVIPSPVLFAQNPDIELLRKINDIRLPWLDTCLTWITHSAGILAWGLPILLLAFAYIKKRPLLKTKGFNILFSVVSSSLVATLIKHIVNRPRPFVTYPFIEKLTAGGSPSFPSGHTADAFALATALCLSFPRWYILYPALCWAFAVAFSRMNLGVHYPSDVLAGAVTGAAAALTTWFIIKHINQKSL